MKMRLLWFAMVAGVVGLLGQAQATVVSFQPADNNLGGLDHNYYYQWGIQWTLPADQQITGAKLYIDDINNTVYEPDQNWLYIHLMNNPQVGITTKSDNQKHGDALAGQGDLIGIYTDNNQQLENLVYDLGQLGLLDELTQHLANGRFGFGFDPDGYFSNDGIRFEITTAPTQAGVVPEPSTMMLGLLGLGGTVLGWRRRRAKSA